MTYSTRRDRIAAEKAAHRSRRRRSLTVGAAGFATIAGATVAGIAPASANDAAYAGQSSSSSSSWSYSGDASGSSNSSGYSGSASGGGVNIGAGVQHATLTASTGSGWKASAAQWATSTANSSSTYYQWGGNGPNGYDCSGFTKAAFAQAGKELPRNSAAQYGAASQYVSKDNLQVGDLVFWSNNGSSSGIYHVAIYIGDGKIAHARNSSTGVTVTAVDYSPHNMLSTAARY